MRTTLLSAALLSLLLPTACKSTGEMMAQDTVASVAMQHPDCTRLTVHCTKAGADGPTACASTAAEKVGKPSDPEDLRAIESGETVVLEEGDALDITVPIMAKDGMFTGACGVTLMRNGKTREQLVERAKAIAMAVEAGMCGPDGTCCCK